MKIDNEIKANPEVKTKNIEEKRRENQLDKMREHGDER